MPSSSQRDPRSIITPDAFEVSEALMGMPLALPRTRAIALAIDGIVIGIITAVTNSFALILGIVAAAFFIRAGMKRTKVTNSVFGRAMRFSVGCLGMLIGIVTAVIWAGSDFFDDEDVPRPALERAVGAGDLFQTGLGALTLIGDMESAESAEEAAEAGRQMIVVGRQAGLDDQTIRDAIVEMVPEGVDWEDEWEALVDDLFEDPSAAGPDDVAIASAENGDAARELVADFNDVEAMRAYADLLETDDGSPGELRTQLEGRLGPIVAADTLGALADRVRGLQREVNRRRAEADELRAELRAADGGGPIAWVRERLDDLGFGFGWAALYMSVFLSWWNGQTVGKRIMRIRVVRLDGEPITWWTAFERAGGYAAGLATGLLGFAQVWWDSNRQAIHDRIVGTVVVIDGADPVDDWESAL